MAMEEFYNRSSLAA